MKKELFKIFAIALFIIAAMSACKPEKETTKKPEMVYVEGGTFIMGCSDDDCQDERELPAHKVTLGDFYISKYTVTQKEWEIVMNNNPSLFKGNDIPVHRISWDDAQLYIAKLNAATGKQYRLPTEAEWEYAARGGNKSRGYKYSGSNNPDEVAWYDANSYTYGSPLSHPVGKKMPNELGIYDMSGNIGEFCSDWYDVYTNDPVTNPTGAVNGTYRVIRGGSFNLSAIRCKVSARGICFQDTPFDNIGGIRLVLPVK